MRRSVSDRQAAKELQQAIDSVSRNVFGKMLFGLRETLDGEMWPACFAALSEAACKPAVWERQASNGGNGKRAGKMARKIDRMGKTQDLVKEVQ